MAAGSWARSHAEESLISTPNPVMVWYVEASLTVIVWA